jgi:hypothetical protein
MEMECKEIVNEMENKNTIRKMEIEMVNEINP